MAVERFCDIMDLVRYKGFNPGATTENVMHRACSRLFMVGEEDSKMMDVVTLVMIGMTR